MGLDCRPLYLSHSLLSREIFHVPLCGTRTLVSSRGARTSGVCAQGHGHLRPSEWSCWHVGHRGKLVSVSLVTPWPESRGLPLWPCPSPSLPGSPDLSPPGCGCRADPKGRDQEVVTNGRLVTLQTWSPGPHQAVSRTTWGLQWALTPQPTPEKGPNLGVWTPAERPPRRT